MVHTIVRDLNGRNLKIENLYDNFSKYVFYGNFFFFFGHLLWKIQCRDIRDHINFVGNLYNLINSTKITIKIIEVVFLGEELFMEKHEEPIG